MSAVINSLWDMGNYFGDNVGVIVTERSFKLILYFLLFFTIVSLIVELVFVGLFGDLLRKENVVAEAYNGNNNPLQKEEIKVLQYERVLNIVYYITNTFLLTIIAFCCVYMALHTKK